jgi:Sulfotransferase family
MKVGGRLRSAYRSFSRSRKPLTATPDIDGARFLFIGGLHRSGTSIIHRLLREHPGTSGFHDTPAPEDEGQHLQSVFPPAKLFGGAGRFAFANEARLLGTSACASESHRRQLLREWGAYYDLTKTVLLEKSPPNLIRGRFLQAMFPGAGFLFILRHPIPVSYATQKWSNTSMLELLFHWCVAHRLMLDDLQYLHRVMVVRYEDLVSSPVSLLKQICNFAGLADFSPRETISDHNERYFSQWKRDMNMMPVRLGDMFDVERGVIATFGYRISDPFVTPWAPGDLRRQTATW